MLRFLKQFKLHVLIVLVVCFWGTAFVGIRIGLKDYSPGSLGLLRYLTASISMMLIYFLMPEPKKMNPADGVKLASLGFIGIGLYNYCLNTGELSISVAVAGFIIGLMPIFTLLLSIIFLKERPTYRVYFGMLISLLGLSLIILAEDGSKSNLTGFGLVLIASFAGAFYTIAQKKFLNNYHPVQVAAWTIWGGTLPFLWFFPKLKLEFLYADWSTTLTIIYLGVFPAALSYVGWSIILKYISASKAALSVYASPIIAMIFGYLLLNELPPLLALGGGLFALLGALWVSLFR